MAKSYEKGIKEIAKGSGRSAGEIIAGLAAAVSSKPPSSIESAPMYIGQKTEQEPIFKNTVIKSVETAQREAEERKNAASSKGVSADPVQRTVEDTGSYKATKSENKSSGLNRDDDISVIYSDDGLIKAGKYGKAGKESYTRSEIDKMVESMYNSLKNPKSSNKTSQIRNLRFALDVYRAENGSLPAEYEKLYSQLRSIDTGKGDGTVIRNASSKEKAEVSKVKSVPIGKLVRFNTSNEVAASVEKIKRDYMSKSASELTAEDVGVLVINKIIDLDEIKKSEPSIYIDLVEKYKRHINSDNVSLTQNASLATDNTARNAWNAIEGVGRGVVNAGAALYNLGAQNESVDDFIEKNVVSDKLDDRLRYMPEGLRTATDIIGSSAQLIPTIALGSINPALGMALIGTSSFGNSYSDALKDGASRSGAFWYGALNAVAELTIEKIAGGVPGLGKGLMTKTTSRIVNSFKRPAVQKLVRVGLEAGGEGMEELYTYLLEPVFKKVYDSDAKLDYSAEQAAYNFLGGFVGSAIFGGAAVAIGVDNDPAPGEIAKAQEAINKFKQSAFHNGISDIKTQKALKAAERAVKNVSYYIGENNTYNVPKEVAQMLSMSSGQRTVGDAAPYSATYSQGGFGELVRATDTVRRNPDSAESQELIDRYAGVGNTSVVRNDAYKKLVSDKKISRREAAAMDSLAYDFGANIEFVDNLTDEYGKPINGEYSEDGRTIRISTQSTDPFFATVLHESVHALRRGDSLSFYRLNSELKNLVGTNTSEFSKAYSTVKRSYARRMTGNKAIDKDLVDEEFTSFMLSYLMDNPQTLKKIAQKNMNSVQKIVDTVLGWFDKSISRYENMDTRYQGNFADAVAKLRDKRDAFAHLFGRASEGYYRSPISFDVTPDSTKKSIVTLPDGKKFVRASRQVIKGATPEEWAQDVMHHINREIRHGRDVDFVGMDGDILTITRDTAGKARYRNFTQKKGGIYVYDTDDEYALKLRVESHIDEISAVSKNSSRELTPDRKNHPFAKDGFTYRTAFFEDFDGQYYKVRISVGHNGALKTVYNVGKIKLEGDPPGGSMAVQHNVAEVTPSNKLSIPHNQPFDNTNINENASVDLEDVHSGGVSAYSNAQARYGLEGVEDYGGVSFARADVDERLGREFQFEDNTVTSRVRDRLGNSLHLSDNVVFEYGERANVEYGTGRIVSIGEDGTVEIAVDSGNFRDSVVIPSRQITFVSHNDESTISEEIRTSHPMYESARNAYENFLRNQSSGIGVDANNIFPGFDFGKAQYYLFSSNNKLRAIEAALRKHTARDDGTNRSHYSNRYSEDAGDVNPDDYELMSANDLLIRYHEAVTNYNLAKEITDIYIRSGADVVDVDNMVMKLQDVDRILPGQKRTHAQKNKNSRYFKSGYGKNNVFRNGSYQFNDVYRNFQRVFGNHFDVVKPLLDNLDRAKGDYARNLMCNADVLLGMCSEYDFKPGDMFDMAIQWFGEKNIHFDLNNSKHRKLFGKLGYDEANFQYQDEFDVAFDYAQLEKLLGSERAAQAAECAGRFRAMYDDYLKRANDTISRIYPGQSDRLIKPRKDYFRHFSEMSDDLFSLGFALVDEKQIDPMLSGISNRTQPKQSFESYRQERKADNTDFSAVRGFVDYMQQAEYTININPFIKEFRELRQGLAHIKSQHGQSDLNSFLKYLDTYANHLAKKTTGFDRIFTDFLGSSGRTMLHGLELVNGRVMKNAVIGNAATAVKQVLNLKNGIFYLQNPGLLANATLGLGKALTSDRWLLEHYNRLFEQSNYLAERFLDMNFANKRSGSQKIAENLISIGDEFSVRAVWLAAYEDAVKLDVPDPVVYADDIARRCSAGRGIGEKPLAFTQQVTKLFLPFLLENNNNWNVYRDFFVDTVQANVGDNHEFGDRNSYLYYKNQKKGASCVAGNSFKLAIFLLMTVGIGDLIEELTGSRPEFDPLNDFRKGFKNAIKDSGRFDFATFVDGLINSSKNLAYDFGEHRNFSSAYSAVASYLEDDPLRSNNDFFASVPAASTFGNVISRMVDKDWIGAGMEFGTGFLMPYGGGQLKKSIKGVADVAQGGHFVEPFTKSLLTEEKGGLMYEVKKSPGNYARGALFGSSALPEARKYWADREEEKRMSGDISDIKAEDFETYKAQFKKSKNKDASSRELWRLRNYTGSDSALPYHYFESDVSYKNRYGEDEVVSITEAERANYQSELNDLLKKKYDEIVKSDKYKNSDDAGKVKLLSAEREKIVKSYNTKLESEFKNKGAFDAYVAAHGEDDIVKLIRKNGNDYSLLPVYDVYRNREFTLNNEERSFELTNEQIDNYSELTGQKISEEYAKVVAGKDWASLSDKQKAEKLKKAKDKAKSAVSDYVKWDYVYKDAMEAFDAELGEDNPVRRAYEYSHDATVYPFWDLNPTITFTYKKKSYSYTLSKEPNSYRDEVEYEVMSKAYSDRIKLNYVKNAIGGGYLKGKSDKEIYDTLMQYKSDIRTKVLNEELRNYAKAKLGLPY